MPTKFSEKPSYPHLVLTKRGLSGALNMPGEWQRATTAVVERCLCDSRLPDFLGADQDCNLPPAECSLEGAVFLSGDSPTLGPATPTFFVRNSQDARLLGSRSSYGLSCVLVRSWAEPTCTTYSSETCQEGYNRYDSPGRFYIGNAKGFAMNPSDNSIPRETSSFPLRGPLCFLILARLYNHGPSNLSLHRPG